MPAVLIFKLAATFHYILLICKAWQMTVVSDAWSLYYFINERTSSRNSSFRKSPLSIKDWI